MIIVINVFLLNWCAVYL